MFRTKGCLIPCCLWVVLLAVVAESWLGDAENTLGRPRVGAHHLSILSPNVLELTLVNTKPPDPALVDQWDFVGENFALQLVDAASSAEVFSGPLRLRPDQGFTFPTYQRVLQADFTEFRTPGRYRLVVPGLGASFPFWIDEGVPAAFARAYALGLYHQRCGAANELPFTRFTHGPCHTTQAEVPTMAFKATQQLIKGMSDGAKDDPRHTISHQKQPCTNE